MQSLISLNQLFKRNTARTMLKRGLVFVLIAMMIVSPISSSFAATYTFVQTDWSGGASEATATHNPVNSVTSGWNAYGSKDSNITVVNGGADVEMTTVSATSTQQSSDGSTDTHNAGGFNAGLTKNNVTTSNNYVALSYTEGIVQSYAMGANPYGIAFDPVTNSVWVANYGSGSVSKVNITTGTKVDYAVGTNPYGIAFDPVTNSVWVANNSSNTVSKVNITTGTKVDYVTGAGPRGVAFDPVTNSVWVANNSSNTVSKVNITTGTKVDYAVGTNPIDIAFDPVTNSVWVVNGGGNTVSKVNITTGTRADYAVGNYPLGVAFDPVTNSVWVTNYNSNTVSKVNITTGTRVDYAMGTGPRAAIFDPVTNSVWVANGVSGSVSKVNITTGTKVDYAVGTNPVDIAFDPVTNSVWVVNYSSNTVSKIIATLSPKVDYAVGSNPYAATFDPVTNSVWVTNYNSNTVSKVNITTGTRVDYAVGTRPYGVAFDPVTNSVWVANNSSNTVSKVNITTGTKVDYVTGSNPYAATFDPVTNSVWVANYGSGSVSKVNITTGTKVDYATGASPLGVAFDSVTNSVWVTNHSSSTVSKVNITTGTKVDYAVGTNPLGVAFDSVTNSVWVANYGSGSVSKVNITTGTKVDYAVGTNPYGVAFDPVTNSVWVTNYNSNTVSKVNITTGTKVDYVTGAGPMGVAFDPVTNSVWVVNGGGNSVSKIPVIIYAETGTFVSAPINVGIGYDFTTLSFNATNYTGTTLTVDVRAGDSATPDGSWTDWVTNILSGGSIAAVGTHQYIQYRANLVASNTRVSSPRLNSITFNYVSYPTSAQTIISSSYNTTDAANLLSKIQWTELLPSGTNATFQLRTSPDNSTWTEWAGPDGTSGSYFTDFAGSEALPLAISNGAGDQWVQYKAFLTSTGVSTPTLSDFTLTYVVNAAPSFNPEAASTAIQIASSTDPDWGKVAIAYSVRDVDTLTGSNTPGIVTPSFEYNIGGGWQPITTTYLATGALDNKAVTQDAYTPYTLTWDAKAQIPNTSVANATIRISVSDNELANGTTTQTTAAFILDTLAPTLAITNVDASNNVVAYNASDANDISYRLSNNIDLSYDTANANSGTFASANGPSINATSSWMFVGAPSYQTMYMEAMDVYGNAATVSATAPLTPTNFDIKDISNIQNEEFREFISWKVYAPTTTAQFSRYELWRSTDGSTYTIYQTFNDVARNYYNDLSLASSTTYYYKLRVIDTDSDLSPFSNNTLSDMPDGQGGSDFTPPEITNVVVAEYQATWAKIAFTTNELTFPTVVYSPTNNPTAQVTETSLTVGTDHVVILDNLEPNTSYIFSVIARDIFNNETTNTNGGALYTFNTVGGPKISDVTAILTDDKNASIVWNTNRDSNSTVVYATSITDLTTATNTTTVFNGIFVGGAGPLYQHRTTLAELSPRTTYFYYVKSADSDGNIGIDKNNLNYYTFTTSYDQKVPVISDITTPVLTPNAIVVIWKTDELANAKLEWGTAEGIYGTSTTDDTMSISHALTMSGLVANTTYHYAVTSCDPADNCTTSPDAEVKSTKDMEVTIVTIGGQSGQFKDQGEVKDVIAPLINNVTVTNTTAFGATITFETSEPTVAFTDYGKDSNYTHSYGNRTFASSHSATITGLRIGTEYHYQIKVLDRGANETTDIDRTFTTKFLSEPADELKTLDDITAYEQISEDALESILPSIRPPFVEEPRVIETTENTATIRWRTNINAYAGIVYSEESEYSASSTTPYANELSKATVKEKDHTMTLVGLKPNTTYHFMVRAFSLPQIVGVSPDITFVTKAAKVSARIINVKNTSFTVVWNTEDPASTIVEYKNLRTGEIQRKIDNDRKLDHEVLVERLLPATSYEVSVFGYNEKGNLIEGGALITIATSRDVVAPKISNFKVDGALVPGRTDRIQTVITWATDEASDSTIYYQEGSGTVAEFANKAAITDTFTQNHTIILSSLKPGTIYQMRVESVDPAGNKAVFGPRTIITPQKGESIFDVIFKNFEDTFKFLRGAGQ